MSKSYSLSKISLAIALSVAGQSAFAQITASDAHTQVSHNQGVEIVNIATPSQAGLSHNRYDKFNVDHAGAVLNNARHQGQSQLAGTLEANPNLHTQSAKVILNEVVSRNASHLAGQQEIFGERADYVLANPNGISVQGGGFINTPRASLVVGRPEVNAGELQGYDVKGDKALVTNGKVTTSGDLDLIAPQVSVGGHITTSEGVNVITGRNHIAREDNGSLRITATEQTGRVLDGKVVGSIQAGRIRIHSTDDRATITAQSADLQAKQVDIAVGNAALHGTIVRHSDRHISKVSNQKGVSVHEQQSGFHETYQGTHIQAERLNVDVRGKLDISGANIQAKSSQISGGNVYLGVEKTVNLSEQSKNQSKGRWYRNESESKRVETLHRTTIAGDSVNIVATKGKVTAEAAKITAETAALYGEHGINLQGAKATTKQSARADFKNETWRLKTGSSSQEGQVQHYTATEVETRKDFVLGGKDHVNLSGVVANVDGSFLAKNSGTLSFASEKSTQNHNIHENMKSWGGFLGGKNVGTGRSTETIHGASVTVKGDATLDATQGVHLTGSRVIVGGEGVVKGNAGALTIDSARANNHNYDHARKGTIFNITTARKSSFEHTSTASGSTLQSESNLQLSTNRNVSIVGSDVKSAGLLSIAAKIGIEVKGAANYIQRESHEAGFSLGGSVDGLKATLQHGGLTTSLNLGKGLAFDSLQNSFQYGGLAANLNVNNNQGKPSISSDVTIPFTLAEPDKLESAVKVEGKFQVGLHAYNNSQNSQEWHNQASHVKGGDVALTAKNVGITGSEVVATKGDLSIKADKINTAATSDQSITHSVKNETNIGLSGTVSESKVSGTLGIGVAHSTTDSTKNKAQVSQLSAARDVSLNANRIEHQGSSVQAGGSIHENAKDVLHHTAKNSSTSTTHNVKVGAEISAGIDKSKAVNFGAKLSANGSNENTSELTHQATQFQAGRNIHVQANHIVDQATSYTAGGNAQFNSQNHQFSAESNRTSKDKMSAGVTLGVSADTKDFQNYNLAANVGANYKQSSGTTNTAVLGAINAQNVDVNTGKFISQANIQGKGNVNIYAQTASFSQASNSKNEQAGGFDAKLSVGAVAVPALSVAVPSIDVSASANGKNASESSSVLGSVVGKNVNIQTQGVLNVQGTNVQADDHLTLSGKRVNVTSGTNYAHNTEASVSAGVNIGAKVSKAGFSSSIGVNVANSQTHTSVKVNGQNVDVHAQNGVNLQGVSSNSQHLNVDAGKGNLSLTAAKDTVNKTDVSVSLKLGGGVVGNKWTPASGEGSLGVNTVRNETFTETALNTQSATLNAGGDAKFVGGSVNANNVQGTIAGNSHTEQLANKVNEVGVQVAANGSGKLTLATSDKWAEAAKNDWNNGTIAGVSSDVTVETKVNQKQSATNAGVNAKQNHLVVKGVKTRKEMRNNQSRNLHVKVHATTNIHKVVESKLPEKLKPMLKPIKGVHVQIAKDSKVVPNISFKN